jgi:Uma2 family endonuclease
MLTLASSNSPLITAEQLLRMPQGSGREYLLQGRVVHQPFRTALAGRAATRLMFHLGAHVMACRLGEVMAPCGFQLTRDPDTVLAPAAAFVRDERRVETDGYPLGPPDLAVEVDCPSEEPDHLGVKVAEWRAAGCQMVIVVNPRRRAATVYRSLSDVQLLSQNDSIEGGDVVPGWKLPLRSLFG